MSVLGDHFPDEIKQKKIAASLKPGVILYLFSTFTTPNKDKYLIVSHAGQPDGVLLLLVNSRIHPFTASRQHLAECQVKIKKKDYPFFDHDSYIDCSQVFDDMSIEEIKKQLSSDMGRIKCEISSETRQQILDAVKKARTVSLLHKKSIIASLK